MSPRTCTITGNLKQSCFRRTIFASGALPSMHVRSTHPAGAVSGSRNHCYPSFTDEIKRRELHGEKISNEMSKADIIEIRSLKASTPDIGRVFLRSTGIGSSSCKDAPVVAAVLFSPFASLFSLFPSEPVIWSSGATIFTTSVGCY